MATKYVITAEQKAEIEQARKANKDKRIEAKLKVLAMRADGASAKEIGEVTEFHPAYVSTIVSKYVHGGLEAITGSHYNHILSVRSDAFDFQQVIIPFCFLSESLAPGRLSDKAAASGADIQRACLRLTPP